MLTVQEATRKILATCRRFGTTELPFGECVGEVLAEALVADRDFPPYDRVAMDGIALRSADFTTGQRLFRVAGVVPAGVAPMALTEPGTCVEIMTGAVLPPGADAVVRYEDVILADGQATVQIDDVAPGKNIHPQGKNRLRGEVVVPTGQVVSPAELGVAATVGQSFLTVYDRPAIAIVSTGDELVPVADTPLPYQIRGSNVYQISGLLHQHGYTTEHFHLPDDPQATQDKLKDLLDFFPLIILTGGVSKGKFDYVPEVLRALGVEQLLHRIAQRPGKPLWFGQHAQGVVFGLPGNPVSSFVCTVRYVRPWLYQSLHAQPYQPTFARLAADHTFAPALTHFIPVRLYHDESGQQWADPLEDGGSGNLAKLTRANAIMELPAEQSAFAVGSVYPVWAYA